MKAKVPKVKYNVYIMRVVEGDYGDVYYEDFAGTTFATSEAKAISNIKYRTGFKPARYSTIDEWLRAIPASEDCDQYHKDYRSYNNG